MCGIVGVLPRRSSRQAPDQSEITSLLAEAKTAVANARESEHSQWSDCLNRASNNLEQIDQLVSGSVGIEFLLTNSSVTALLGAELETLESRVSTIESELEKKADSLPSGELEEINAALVRIKDANWSLVHDRLRSASAVARLAQSSTAYYQYRAIEIALASIDRLEVRGRDSAGLNIVVSNHGLEISADELANRKSDLFVSNEVRAVGDSLSFVYKTASEVGELGANTARLSEEIIADDLLRRALSAEGADVAVLGHTRWASVGTVSVANAHPVNSEGCGADTYSVAVLNGDVDNYQQLMTENDLHAPPLISTDAKVIPSLFSKLNNDDEKQAFCSTIASLEGSVAVGLHVPEDPDQMYFALNGSGQGLYIGAAEDTYIVASEPYGLIHETRRYLRLDGQRRDVVVLDRSNAGILELVERCDVNGTNIAIEDDDIRTAQVTSRDINRGEYPHFLLKELAESPNSFKKTLRGRLRKESGKYAVELGPEALPDSLIQKFLNREIKHVYVIGQGTAAIAGSAVAAFLDDALSSIDVAVEAVTSAEFSGFMLEPRMNDSMVVAVSQSGTTTDTNRAVTMAKSRGSIVMCIVNRRNSDLVSLSDGVVYTSDGRDIEMSVASTKAFYSQVAAGLLVAAELQQKIGRDDDDLQTLLTAVSALPNAMREVLAKQTQIAEFAGNYGLRRREWAIVGNGWNTIAANEIRIKLSELCYKAIARDMTEDKKHIDLSTEPLILVCAAGTTGAVASDVAKEVAIFKAHQGAPIVIATQGESAFANESDVIWVPATHTKLAFILAAMAGHIFGYETALAIDSQTSVLREARAVVETALERADDGRVDTSWLSAALQGPYVSFMDRLKDGYFNAHLDAAMAARLIESLSTVTHSAIADADAAYVDLFDLTALLNEAIAFLSRPIDTIKHQAKTVTVGTSRTEHIELEGEFGKLFERLAITSDLLSYSTLHCLREIERVVDAVSGYTRYAITTDSALGAQIQVVDRGGVSEQIASRADSPTDLVGNKRRVALEREVLIVRGQSDGRLVTIIPEIHNGVTVGVLLIHTSFVAFTDGPTLAAILDAYDGRLAEISDSLGEIGKSLEFSDLAAISVEDALVEPISELITRLR